MAINNVCIFITHNFVICVMDRKHANDRCRCFISCYCCFQLNKFENKTFSGTHSMMTLATFDFWRFRFLFHFSKKINHEMKWYTGYFSLSLVCLFVLLHWMKWNDVTECVCVCVWHLEWWSLDYWKTIIVIYDSYGFFLGFSRPTKENITL